MLDFGGMCLPKDLKSLCEFAERTESLNKIMKSTLYENKKIREE